MMLNDQLVCTVHEGAPECQTWGHAHVGGIIWPHHWNRVDGGGVVIFNDANVMTTDDIVTTCQRDRAQPAPGL